MDCDTKAAFSGVNTKLDKMDSRFDKVDRRFDKVDGRLDLIHGRLDRHEALLVKLAEGQAKLTEQVTRSAGLISALAVEVQHLGEHMDASIAVLTKRMDNFAEQVMRGFTKRDEEHAALESRVSKPEHQ